MNGTFEGGGPSLCRILAYNIHECVGRDGRRDAERVAGIIRDLDPDIVGLQEVDNDYLQGGDSTQLRYLAEATGLTGFGGPTLWRGRGDYGNALLTRGEVLAVRRLDLSFPDREPRGAIDVDLKLRGKTLRVFVTHMGLRPAERRFQVRELVAELGLSEKSPVVLLGDLNEWFHLGRPSRWLHRYFGQSPALRTFPSGFPLFALDRVLVRPREALRELRTVRNRKTRVASDHLPLLAEVAF